MAQAAVDWFGAELFENDGARDDVAWRGAHEALCSAHHRAIHRGELLIESTPSTGLRFLHADGTVYGGLPSPSLADVRTKACRALELMGYRAGEAKNALLRIREVRAASLEQVIRQALQELAASKKA